MDIEFGLLEENLLNTSHASLAALSAHYRQNSTLKPLEAVKSDEGHRPANEVKRVLEVGRLLLSVLTQSEVEMLRRHFQNELPNHNVGYSSPDTADDGD